MIKTFAIMKNGNTMGTQWEHSQISQSILQESEEWERMGTEWEHDGNAVGTELFILIPKL